MAAVFRAGCKTASHGAFNVFQTTKGLLHRRLGSTREGHVYFKERMYFQIKVRGYRIELDEVAGAIRDCGWPVVCVSKHGDGIAAVVESQAGVKLDEISLLRSLEKTLEHLCSSREDT
jgi:D-alanine--poly(phosphoribitol) ligase subunit 1